MNVLTFLLGPAAASHINNLRRDRNRWRTAARRLGALGVRQASQVRRQNTIVQEQAQEIQGLRGQVGAALQAREEKAHLAQLAGRRREQAEQERDTALARLALLENKDLAALADELAAKGSAIERLEEQAARYRAEIADLEGKLSGRAIAAQTRPVRR